MASELARISAGEKPFIFAILAAGLAGWSGCGNQDEGPVPKPASVDPLLICGEQLTTVLTLRGDKFSPAPVEALAGAPKIAIPKISLERTADFEGGTPGDELLVLNDDPADQKNTSVFWSSQKEMTFVLDPAQDSALFPGGKLPAGVYDLTVANPTGGKKTLENAFAAVPPPILLSATPTPVCVAQYENQITLLGDWFLKIGAQLPHVRIGERDYQPASVEDCRVIETPLGGVERCANLQVTAGIDDFERGTYAVAVTNPAPATCVSTEPINWHVVPPPVLENAEPQPICNAQGERTIVLTGDGFLRIGAELPTVMAGGFAVATASLSGCQKAFPGLPEVETCSTATVLAAPGAIPPGAHKVVLTNPDPAGCASTEAVLLHIVPPPAIASLEPPRVCIAQSAQSVALAGSDFLKLGDSLPAVTVSGLSVTLDSLGGCEPAFPTLEGVERCASATVIVAQNLLEAGTYEVVLTNPDPAGCYNEEPALLEITLPPEVLSVTPAHLCTGGGVLTVSGANLWGLSAVLADSSGRRVEAANVTVNEDGTEAQAGFTAGLRAETYTLEVTGIGGCIDTVSETPVTVDLGPAVFYVDPPVVYSGVAIRATVYISGANSAPARVYIAPAGGGEPAGLTDVAWNAGKPNLIQGTLRAGLPAGIYDLTVSGVGGCDAVLANALTVVDVATLALASPPLTPAFGEANQAVAVNVNAKADGELAAGEVNFRATPRVYLSSTALSAAEPLRAVVFEANHRLTAVAPPLAEGTYDLVVVNPEGAVGFAAAAFRTAAVPPPVIDGVNPSMIGASAGQVVTITGANFFDPGVTLECNDGSQPAAVVGASAADSLEVTIDAASASNGAACVVRVTNKAEQTFDEWSALSTANPAGNLTAFAGGTALTEARRGAAVAVGRATREARFLYAIGGDDGSRDHAKLTVEAAPLGRFGDLGAWLTLQTALPAGRTLGTARVAGRFVLLLGGIRVENATAAVTGEILRAKILDPFAAPAIEKVDVRFAANGAGLAPGAWTYVVAAVLETSDAENPGGETLPSEPLTLYAPNVPGGIEVELIWNTIYGAAGSTPADRYRVYRTTAVNSTAASLRLLAEVQGSAAATHGFIDANPAVFAGDTKEPLRIGALGEWQPAGNLNTPRAAFGFVENVEPGCARFWYVFGGETNSASESATYEVAKVTGEGDQAAPGAFAQFSPAAGSDLDARRELSVWTANARNSTAEQLGACEFYFYTGPGAAGPEANPNAVADVRVATVAGLNSGELGAFGDALNTGSNIEYAGYAAFFSGQSVYTLGGKRGGAVSGDATEAQFCRGGGCSEPVLRNFNSSSASLREARYLFGYTREGAFNYLAGGLGSTNQPSATTEMNIR